MFNPDFYPTPSSVIDTMLEGESIAGKVCFDPEGGKGDLVDRFILEGAAQVLTSEIEKDLLKILAGKACKIIGEDFLQVTADQISHVDYIIMNPPFSKAPEHITHAYEIAPDGCKIIALCNASNLKNQFTESRKRLGNFIELYGSASDLGPVFSTAQRKTEVEVSLIRLLKPGSYDQEFSGFFTDDDPEEEQFNGLMPYNFVRDLVQRYVTAIKIFDTQLETAERLNETCAGYFGNGGFAVTVTQDEKPVKRAEFKKDLQKDGWNLIFSKLNMQKFATKGLKAEINAFVEKQTNIPFTMRNIYKMLEVVIGTTGSRMDKALVEVFDRITDHHHDNRHNLEGWKTNSHYLLTKRFICPQVAQRGYQGQVEPASFGSWGFEMIEDLVKALCFLTGKNYDDFATLNDTLYSYKFLADKEGRILPDKYFTDYRVQIKSRDLDKLKEQQKQHFESQIINPDVRWGTWFDWGFFRVKVYKKGTAHIEFKDMKVWEAFNVRVAKIKGYPLPEQKAQTAYQDRQTGTRRKKPTGQATKPQGPAPVILATIKIKGNDHSA